MNEPQTTVSLSVKRSPIGVYKLELMVDGRWYACAENLGEPQIVGTRNYTTHWFLRRASYMTFSYQHRITPVYEKV